MSEHDDHQPRAVQVIVTALVGISLALDIAGWIVYDHRGRGLGLMIFGLVLMLVVMAVAVIGIVVLWPAGSTAPASRRPRFIIGLLLCITTAVLLVWNAIFLLTADICATCF